MVKQFLLLACVAASLPAVAQREQAQASAQTADKVVASRLMAKEARVVAKMNDGSVVTSNPAKAAQMGVQWKRPAGQFWGVGYNVDVNQMGYYFTPLMLRPWVDYTFENVSTLTGEPSWAITNWSNQTGGYEVYDSNETNATVSYLRYETGEVPMLSYKNQIPYATQYYGKNATGKAINVCANDEIEPVFGAKMPVSSHYWGMFTRHEVERSGFGYFSGADVYPGMNEDDGLWFGTNNSGINAMATRFEKPDMPYLLNGIYWYYQFFQDVPNDIPMKAYVFKTENDAELVETSSGSLQEQLLLGELLAESESFIPAAVFNEETGEFENAVHFEFFETNPVTGAKTAYSLEIEDDITIIVTGFNANLGNGGVVTTFLSNDQFDEGYGNLGFLGSFEETEDGSVSYWLPALKNFFVSPLHNTTLGVLADVSYPWLSNYYIEQPTDIDLPNEGETTETQQGLQYALWLMSTAMTEDFTVTYNGEDECDWLEITEVYDEMDDESGEEEFAGITALLFEAAPNPADESRTCVVRVSIPGAYFHITFRQGSQNAVEVVSVEGDAQYFDLQGRRVANPEKGIFIKKAGNTTSKVIL